MDEIYLDVDVSADCKSAFITDWSHYMRAWFVDAPRTFASYEKQFVPIRGKYLTVYVRGLGNNCERCKSFAIWYVCNRESISTHRLDLVYSKRDEQTKRR
jgi:hypothetical protein